MQSEDPLHFACNRSGVLGMALMGIRDFGQWKDLCFAKVRGNPAYDCSQQPFDQFPDPGLGGREGQGNLGTCRSVEWDRPKDPRVTLIL